MYVAFDSPSLTLQRHGDALLVEVFMNAEVDQDILKWLNWCRMYLQVTSVADICTADGKYIRRAAWEGRRERLWQQRYQWPRTVRPANCHWDTWRDVLTSTLLQGTGTHRKLRVPLGTWMDDLDRWHWLYSPSCGLLHRQGHLWLVHTPITRTRLSHRYEAQAARWTQPLPSDALRATVQAVHGGWMVTGTSTAAPRSSNSSPSVLRAWREAGGQCGEYFGWVPNDVAIWGSEAMLADALAAGDLRIVSDGSYSDRVGTAAIQLLTSCGRHRLVARCQTPGRLEDQSAYRSELIGLLSGVMLAEWLRQEWCPSLAPHPTVQIGCDGLTALAQAFGDVFLSPTQAQFDVLSTIHAWRASSPIQRKN